MSGITLEKTQNAIHLAWYEALFEKTRKSARKLTVHTLLATFQTEVGVFENPQDHIHTTAWQGIYLQFSTDDPLLIMIIYRLEKLVEEVSKHPQFEAVAWISWMIFFRFRLRMVIKA